MTQPSPQSPATEVWRRFSGMFGADAVERKYGPAIPDEWHAMLARLNDHQVQRGVRQLAYSGRSHVPSLPEFVKLCRDAEHDIRPPVPHPAIAAPEWDRWLLAGNRRLLGYITRKIPESPHRYDHSGVMPLVAMKNRWVEIMQGAAGPEGVPPDEQNQCWAACMREAEEIIAAQKVV